MSEEEYNELRRIYFIKCKELNDLSEYLKTYIPKEEIKEIDEPSEPEHTV